MLEYWKALSDGARPGLAPARIGDESGRLPDGSEFPIVRIALITLCAWATLVATFGGLSHIDAMRGGQSSTFSLRLAWYGLGFAPWLVLGPGVFFLSRRHKAGAPALASAVVFAVTCFLAAFGAIFLYFVSVYAPISGMTAGEAVSSTRLVDWVPDVFIFLIAFIAGRTPQQSVEAPVGGIGRRIAVRSQGRIDYVPVDEISGGSACGNYITIYAGAREYLHRGAISKMSADLAADGILRVHRSHFVRPEHVVSANTRGARIRDVTLANGKIVPVSAPFESVVKAALGDCAIGARHEG